MNTTRRFVALALVGVLIVLGWSSLVPGQAATPLIAQRSRPSVADLSFPETTAATAAIEDSPRPQTASASSQPPANQQRDRMADVTEVQAPAAAPEDADLTAEAKLSKRQRLLIAADEHYLAGETQAATDLYRQVKDDQWPSRDREVPPEPLQEADALSPGAAVYWREAQQGLEHGLRHRTEVPLQLLTEEHPEFIPAHLLYARYLVEQDRAEEADALLDRALLIYPSQPDLLRARVEVQMARERWIEASITARQFSLLNPNHPDAPAMEALAQENLDRFRAEMNEDITRNFLGNLVTGAAGFFLTGGLVGPFTALNSAILLTRGEDGVGASVADRIKDQVPLVEEETMTAYLNDIGQRLAALTGREEFDYAFYLIDEDELNAFALPGGKIFVNAGAVMKTRSEAELAGLLAHELAHAVLSHGFQMVTNGNLLNSLASFIPVPEAANIAAGLAITGYSRQMERQADVLGTQILAAADYAADGLYNLMVTLQAESGDRPIIPWFSTHPAPQERVDYLQQIVVSGGYNRYAYEGVAPHLAMQAQLSALIAARRHQGEGGNLPER